MGCWNGTCGISQLPISWGDEIVLIPLLSTGASLESGIMYNVTDRFVPLSLPIYGRYNDYGGIEDIDTHCKNEEFFRVQKFYSIAEDEELTKEKLMNAFDKSTFKSIGMISDRLKEEYRLDEIECDDFEEFINNLIHEENYLIKNKSWKSKYSDVNYIMIHKGLYDALINEIGNRVPYNKEKSLRELWKEKIIKEVNYKKEIMSIENKEEREAKEWIYFADSMTSRLGLLEFKSDILGYEYFLNKLCESMDEKLLDELLNLIMLTYSLQNLRKGYLCMTGLGSQQNEIYLHTIVADFIKEYAKEKIVKYDEEWIREDDFSEKEFLSEEIHFRDIDYTNY